MNVLLLGRQVDMSKDDSFSINYFSNLYAIGATLVLEAKIDDRLSGYSQQLSRKIVDTEDNLIKDGLKKLGWISPDEAKRIQNLLRRVAGTQSFYRCGWEGVDPEVKDLLTEVFNDTENN